MKGRDAEDTECRHLIKRPLHDRIVIVIADFAERRTRSAIWDILSIQSVYEVFSTFSPVIT